MNHSIKQFLVLLILPVFLAAVLSLIYILPEHGKTASSSLTMELPLQYGLPGWYGEKRQESDAERRGLAPDTKFSKADYFDISKGQRANLYACHLSIVLSGEDMNSSIHRPEVCLPSQGHFNLMGGTRTITVDNGRQISMTRLHSQIRTRDGHLINCISYYLFVGNGDIAHRHETRVIKDFKKRIFEGTDQRWAYIQVGTYYGNVIGTTEEEADEEAQKLLKAILPRIIKWEEIDN